MKQLIVTVDTEEEGLWGGDYRVTGNTTENLRGLPQFQATCERLGVPPTYLIDAPVVTDAGAMRDLRRWQEAGVCEVGAHCHPWCNPPLSESPPTSAETFLCNLPKELQHEKLSWLTGRIAEEVGQAPTSYRAGRYGFDRTTAEVLHELGYRVDSSVLPMYDYRSEKGPDYRFASRQPARYFGDGDSRTLAEIPVTAGFTRSGYDTRRRLWLGLRQPRWTRFRLAGVADRTGLVRRVKLTPEGTQLGDLRRLIDACATDGLTTLVLMLHSSSLIAGLSPYAETEERLEGLYRRLREAIEHATARHGFKPQTLSEAAGQLDPSATDF